MSLIFSSSDDVHLNPILLIGLVDGSAAGIRALLSSIPWFVLLLYGRLIIQKIKNLSF
jgi:hypothetical protein